MTKTEETWMDGITTEMMEHICDNLCKYPNQLSGEQLEDKCAELLFGKLNAAVSIRLKRVFQST